MIGGAFAQRPSAGFSLGGGSNPGSSPSSSPSYGDTPEPELIAWSPGSRCAGAFGVGYFGAGGMGSVSGLSGVTRDPLAVVEQLDRLPSSNS